MSEDKQLTVYGAGLPSASPSTAQVCAALASAQGKFRNPKRTKTATVRPRDGGAGYTFAYAPLEEVVDAVKDGLAENGLSRQQYLFRADDGQFWLKTVLWHASGEWMSGDYPVMYVKESAQGFAGGVTYAKRNGLSLLLGLAAEDDDDGNVGDGNAAVIKPTMSTRSASLIGNQNAARKPKEPAPNVMQPPPHDAQTGEVLQALPATDAVNEALEARIALLTAVAMGRGVEKGKAEVSLRKEWNNTPLHLQEQLRSRTKDWLRIARDIDQAHAMAQEQQG